MNKIQLQRKEEDCEQKKTMEKKNIHLKNNDNNNENDMCFCCNVATH
jgi:hypothetical protein